LVESIIATGHFSTEDGTAATHTFSAGKKVTPTVDERLDRLDRLEQAYRDLLEKGLERRVVRDRQTAITTIRDHLAAAPTEIWVMDPYFGFDHQDWAVLTGLRVPIKVLTGRNPKKPPPSCKHRAGCSGG
jgi:hypothetical protein